MEGHGEIRGVMDLNLYLNSVHGYKTCQNS